MKLLIVEDEKYEREALEELVQERLNDIVDVCMSTNNGLSALQLFEEHGFDIIISDINIPSMTGLELLKEVKRRSEGTRVIILTSYGYFEYALESIRIGVEDFILKPSTAQSKEASIRNAIQKILQEKDNGAKITDLSIEAKAVIGKHFLYGVLCNEDKKVINNFMNVLPFRVNCGVCFAFRNKEKRNSILKIFKTNCNMQDVACASDDFYQFFIVFLLANREISKQEIITIFDALEEADIMATDIGIGGAASDSSHFYAIGMNAIKNLTKKKMNPETLSFSTNVIQELVDSFMMGIQEKDTEIYKSISIEYSQLLLNLECSEYIKLTEILLEKLGEELNSLLSDGKYRDVMRNERNLLIGSSTLKEVRIFVTYTLKNIMEAIYEEKYKNSNKLINVALKFIEKNYEKPIGLNDLAKLMDITPQYVSFLFTQYSGNSFVNTLSEYRINKARELLKQGIQIKEVSYMVGFQNQNYFARAFKKMTGYTPSEFKQKYE